MWPGTRNRAENAAARTERSPVRTIIRSRLPRAGQVVTLGEGGEAGKRAGQNRAGGWRNVEESIKFKIDNIKI
jgi:hypothetical protein